MELVSNATWSPSTVCFTPERLSGVPLRHLRPGDLECASSDAELFRLWASWGVFLSAAAALLLLALWACCRLTSYGRSRRRTRRHLQRQYQQRQYSDISTLPSTSPAAAQQQQAPESSQGYPKTITEKKLLTTSFSIITMVQVVPPTRSVPQGQIAARLQQSHEVGEGERPLPGKQFFL